jgi:hypothetical protein
MLVKSTVLWLIVAHLCGGLAIACLCLVGKSFSVNNVEYQEAGILYPAQVSEIVVAMFAILCTPLACGMVLLTSASLKLSTIFALYVAFASSASAVAAMTFSIEPFRTYNISYADQPDNVQQLLGGIAFAISVPLACVSFIIAATRFQARISRPLQSTPMHPTQRFLGSNAALVGGGIFALGAGLCLTCVLSSVMVRERQFRVNLQTPEHCGSYCCLRACVQNYGPGSYLRATSPFSLVQNVQVRHSD